METKKIHVLDRDFELSIREDEIMEKIKKVAAQLNTDYAGRQPVMMCILNGAFMFAADLVRYLDFQPEIIFARFSSYDGMDTTGEVRELLGITADVVGRDIIIVEDIVDTGITMSNILPKFQQMGASSVKVACLLQKPDKLKVDIKIDYCALQIPNDFIVGYGLDYDGFGRNYRDIYKVV